MIGILVYYYLLLTDIRLFAWGNEDLHDETALVFRQYYANEHG